MSLRNQNGGFIRPGYEPLQVPNEPTSVAVTAGDAELSVAFTAPANVGGGAISSYQAATTTGISATASTSPVVITGLSNGTSYDVRVWAINAYGPGPFGTGSGSPVANRGIFASSGMGIDYIDINTLSNAATFGNLTSGTYYNPAACGSTTRGVIGGGGVGISQSNVLQYITFASIGNATDFGDLASARDYNMALSSATRGIFAGGLAAGGGSYLNTIEYITIASTGNAASFGELIQPASGYDGFSSGGAFASPTRGVVGAGDYGAGTNVIQYITIASTGNATDFGDLLTTNYQLAGFSSSTRGIFAGGVDGGSRNVIQYITIASTGNATDFGDLLFGNYSNFGCSSNTRGIVAGGRDIGSGGIQTNVIQYITIASTGNAVDFGDLLQKDDNAASCSNCGGGVQ